MKKHRRSRVTIRIVSNADDEMGSSRADFRTLRGNPLACALIERRWSPVVVTNEQRRVVLANQAFVRMSHAQNLEELIGKVAGETLGCQSPPADSELRSECRCPGCGFSCVLDGAFRVNPICLECELRGFGEKQSRIKITGEPLRMLDRRFVLTEFNIVEAAVAS